MLSCLMELRTYSLLVNCWKLIIQMLYNEFLTVHQQAVRSKLHQTWQHMCFTYEDQFFMCSINLVNIKVPYFYPPYAKWPWKSTGSNTANGRSPPETNMSAVTIILLVLWQTLMKSRQWTGNLHICLHVYISADLIFYQNIFIDLVDMRFNINPYFPWMANKEIYRKKHRDMLHGWYKSVPHGQKWDNKGDKKVRIAI